MLITAWAVVKINYSLAASMVPGPEMNGSYTDVVAKIGQFDTDIKSYEDYPDKASYNNRAYSVSIEYGKTIELSEKSGTFVEPQLQFIAGRLENSEYTTDRGNNVYIGGLNSYIGRVGFDCRSKNERWQ